MSSTPLINQQIAFPAIVSVAGFLWMFHSRGYSYTVSFGLAFILTLGIFLCLFLLLYLLGASTIKREQDQKIENEGRKRTIEEKFPGVKAKKLSNGKWLLVLTASGETVNEIDCPL